MKAKFTWRGVVVDRPVAAPPSTSKPAGPPKIRVAREVAGRGGKGVTVVTGLPLPDAELEALGLALKKLCGAGGAVRDGRIELQGEHRDRVLAELLKRGFDAKRAGG
jgi:translation initiation factor 1